MSRGPSGQTLEDVLTSAWEDLTAAARAECPVCGDSMLQAAGVGHCGGCGSELE